MFIITNGIDGNFGNGTANAVVQFQRDNNLSADGIVGRNTWRELLGM
ncbi:peptidoglycan-binding domain-containing protein [Clostridium sp. HBUAS56017]|nr:peptidoglycan-binding domain-containing protein [Clostridium sp. HBUAS56017]